MWYLVKSFQILIDHLAKRFDYAIHMIILIAIFRSNVDVA